jgi:hypothetical protein
MLNRQLSGKGWATWDSPPPKPKWMRWQTYERKLRDGSGWSRAPTRSLPSSSDAVRANPAAWQRTEAVAIESVAAQRDETENRIQKHGNLGNLGSDALHNNRGADNSRSTAVSFTLRPAMPEDAEAIAAVYATSFRLLTFLPMLRARPPRVVVRRLRSR